MHLPKMQPRSHEDSKHARRMDPRAFFVVSCLRGKNVATGMMLRFVCSVVGCHYSDELLGLLLRQRPDDSHFRLVERRAVAPEQVVMPHWRLGAERLRPGAPGIDRLRLASDESPG